MTTEQQSTLLQVKMVNYILTILLIVSASSVLGSDNVIIERLKSDVEHLCSPELAGRNAPGETADATALWIAERMLKTYLRPAVGDTSFLQEVQLISAKLDTNNTELTLIDNNNMRRLLQWGEFYTFPKQIAQIDTTLDIKTCGYGIVSSELNMNDFGNTEGKCAVVLDGIGDFPAEKIGRYASAPFKAASAKRAGAEMMMVLYQKDLWLPDAIKKKIESASELLVDLPNSSPDFPIIYTSNEYLTDEIRSISLKIAFENHLNTPGFNVVGRLEGRISEYVVIGAHYDHIGVVKNSNSGEYYAGADDNASGVAGLLEICRRWAGRDRNGRGLIAVSFTAEEDGMLGSKCFVEHLPVPRESIVAMINMDEIGRRGFANMSDVYRPGAVTDPEFTSAYYSGASPELDGLIKSATDGINLNVSANPLNSFGHFGDAGSFHEANIPTMNIFSSFHSDYHETTDTPDKIDYDKMGEIINFVDALLVNLSMSHEKIRFNPEIKVEKPEIPH
jgi:hypothetical protein